jgi:hypothetical protein
MVDLTKLSEGKEKTSGHIVSYAVLGPTEDHAETNLFYVKLVLDNSQHIYLTSTLEYLHQIMERKGRTATFIGDYLNDEKKQLGCDSIVFWDSDSPAQ